MPKAEWTPIDWTVAEPGSGEVIGNELRISGTGSRHLLTIEDPQIEGGTLHPQRL